MRVQAQVILRALCIGAVFALSHFASYAQSPPFTIKVIDTPVSMSPGEKDTFSFDIKNKSNGSIMISSSCAVSANLSWTNAKGSGGGTGSGCAEVPIPKSSFFTLRPGEKKRFQTEVRVPKDVSSKFVIVDVNFKPNAEGTEYGFKAVTGKVTANLKIRINPIH